MTYRIHFDEVGLNGTAWHRLDSKRFFQIACHPPWRPNPPVAGWTRMHPVRSLPRYVMWTNVGVDIRMVIVPYSTLILVALLFPSLCVLGLWRAIRARRRREKGLCARCCYDLRASADRCPECGATIEETKPGRPTPA